MKPKVPFDEKKHDSFVKASLAELHKNRENMVARKLPYMDIKSETDYDVSKK